MRLLDISSEELQRRYAAGPDAFVLALPASIRTALLCEGICTRADLQEFIGRYGVAGLTRLPNVGTLRKRQIMEAMAGKMPSRPSPEAAVKRKIDAAIALLNRNGYEVRRLDKAD